MAKVQKIAVGRKPGQKRIVVPEKVQVSLTGLAGRAVDGLLALSVGVGLEVFKTLLEEDRTTLVGPKGKHNLERAAYRHGVEPSSITLGGRKIAVERPRVRAISGEEVPLATWLAFSGDDLLSEMAFGRMIRALHPQLRGGT